MCLIVLAHRLHADYPLILAANRDEFRARPTRAMHWWPEINILAGQDLKAGGTWLALHQDGRWAALTNFRRPAGNKPAGLAKPTQLKSRGQLALDFLGQTHLSASAFAKQLKNKQFAGFNLLLWDGQDLVYCHNDCNIEPQILPAGLYGLSNGVLNSDWPKVKHVKAQLKQSLQLPPEHQRLQNMMADTTIAADDALPNTGIAIAWERQLSACFIDAPNYDYGTRTCISLWRDGSGTYKVQERCFDIPLSQATNFTWTPQPK